MLKAARTILSALFAEVVTTWTVSLTARTTIAFTAWATLTLYITLRLFEQHATRKLIFSCLRIYFKQLHIDVIAFLNACIFNRFQTSPLYFRDVKQSFFAWKNLNKTAIRHNALDYTIVNFANFGKSNNAFNLSHCSINAILIWSRNLYMTLTISLFNGDSSACIFLHLLDNLSTRANNSTNKLFRNINSHDTWYLWFHLGTRSIDGLHHLIHDMLTTSFRLHKSLFNDIKRQTVTLNIHLCCGQTVHCTSGFKVHVTQMVLISKYVA